MMIRDYYKLNYLHQSKKVAAKQKSIDSEADDSTPTAS